VVDGKIVSVEAAIVKASRKEWLPQAKSTTLTTKGRNIPVHSDGSAAVPHELSRTGPAEKDGLGT